MIGKRSKYRMLLCSVPIYLLSLVLLVSLNGCAHVLYNDWEVVFTQKAEHPIISGMIHKQTPSGIKQTLVLEYEIRLYDHSRGPHSAKLYTAIPLVDGKANAPLMYNGPIGDEYRLREFVSQDQVRSVSTYRFSCRSISQSHLIHKHKMIPVNKKGSCFSSQRVQPWTSPPGTNIIPYWLSDPIRDKSKIIPGNNDDLDSFRYSDLCANPSPLAPPDGMLFVPSKQPSSWAARGQSLVWAIVKTPLDICLDIVSPPIFIICSWYDAKTGNVWW